MKVTGKVIKIEATKGSYAYAVLGENGVTLIDTSLPGRGEAILSELKAYGIQPEEITRILLTHHDVDHIGSAAYLAAHTGCGIYIGADDLPCAVGEKKGDGIKKLLGIFMKARISGNLIQAFDGGINGITVIPSPGHTRGHTSFRFQNVLFAGDMLCEKKGKITPPPGIMTWHMKQNMDSCGKVDISGIDWVCPAHGEPVKITVNEWDEFIKKGTMNP